MEFIPQIADDYVTKYSSALSPLAAEILEFTEAHHAHAHMISGAVQGQFLKFICSMYKPMRVLEVGTFTGFSAICMAEGMPEGAALHTIELRPEDAKTAQGFFDRYNSNNDIILHVGNAIDIIPSLGIEWDLIFIDADKSGYINYYELTLPRLKKGGFILADNTLFHGQVLEVPLSGKNAKVIQAFNDHVQADDRVEQVLLTIRDGLTLIKKK